MIALDTETTGVDLYHGAKPFIVTVCDENGKQRLWQWDVDPITRKPIVPSEDRQQVKLLLDDDQLILHNAKFDYTALQQLFGGGLILPWGRTHDTLLSGHLLGSSQPHNLTDQLMLWCGKDIQPYEEHLKQCCQEARRLCRTHIKHWRIAKECEKDMPSVTSSGQRMEDRPWKNDCWLPRAVAKELELSLDHPWWTVCQEYANQDSAATMLLWLTHREELHRRGLWEIYEESRKLPQILFEMEQRGISGSCERQAKLKELHKTASTAAEEWCIEFAKDRYNYDIQLPAGARNKSLDEFAFEVLKLPVVNETATGKPAFNKETMASWLVTLEGDQLDFVKTYQFKKSRDTAIGYIEGYERFELPLKVWVDDTDPQAALADVMDESDSKWFVLHPSINQTGTVTTRFSSYNPNSTNFSKKEIDTGDNEDEAYSLRWFLGPAPGREYWTFDGENLELRLPAYLADEPELIALFERPKDPPFYGSQHLLNFSTIYPDIWEDAVKKVGLDKAGPYCKDTYAGTWYQWCKNMDFAIQYQAGDKTADKAAHRAGSRQLVLSRFGKLDKLNRDTVRFADKHGYIETIPDRTVNPNHGYPLQCARGENNRIKPTIPLSYMIQGSAGIWVRKAMVRTHQQLNEWRRTEGFDAYLILYVHDELDFDLPKRGDPVAEKKGLAPPGSSNLLKAKQLQYLMSLGGSDFGMPGKTPVSCKYHPENLAQGISL